MTYFEFEKLFSTDKDAIDYYIEKKYHGVLSCPHCHSKTRIYRYRNRTRYFQCKNCNNTFSVFNDTIFKKSRTSIRAWFFVIHLSLNAKKGVSACMIERELKVSYKCAWRILKQLRLAMGNPEFEESFKGIVEADETYIGGKSRRRYFRNYNKPDPSDDVKKYQGRGTIKTPVVGIRERDSGNVYAQVMFRNEKGQKLSGPQLLVVLKKVCKGKTKVMTDDYAGYNILDNEAASQFTHFSVNHSKCEYSAGNGIHTNGIENFWSLLKRCHYGTYHYISVKYLQQYVNEACFRYNNRKNDNIFDVLLKQSVFKKPA